MVLLLASMARPKGVQGLHPLATLCSRFGACEGSVKALAAAEIERRLRLLERESNTRCEVIQLERQVEFERRIRENLQRHEDGPSAVILFPENRAKIGACPSLNTNRTTRVINGVPRSCAAV
jgi:hypothetical protein